MSDPRRFTPNLHANLVNEILSLRRDTETKNREIESKNGVILGLEESLASVRDENSKLEALRVEHVKETKSLKKQMQELEGGALSAIEDLAEERDKSVRELTETRKRLDAVQKKGKSQVDSHDRANELWERERMGWDAERWNYDRKVHALEGRLKTVLAEYEKLYAQNEQRDGLIENHERSFSRASRGSGARSAASRRRDSTNTNDGGDTRNLRLSDINELLSTVGGTTLADELQFMDDNDNSSQYSEDGFPSPEALPEEKVHHQRPFSAASHRASVKARKLLGLDIEEDDIHLDDIRTENIAAEMGNRTSKEGPGVLDAATQWSPPPSPTISPAASSNLSPIHLPTKLLVDRTHSDMARPLSVIDELESNASQENLHLNGFVHDVANNIPEKQELSKEASQDSPIAMVSSGCQTIEQPLSPPDTPIEYDAGDFGPSSKLVEMSTAATQTEDAQHLAPSAAIRAELDVQDIPLIAIHPPEGPHSRSGSVKLPPRTKNASCQASISSSNRSTAVQTEEIRIDQRPVKLPPHLLPSAISSSPPSPSLEAQETTKLEGKDGPDHRPKLQVPPPIQPKSSKRRLSKKNNLLFNGFDSMETRPKGDDEESDDSLLSDDSNQTNDSYFHRAPVRTTLSKVENSWKLVPGPSEGEGEGDSAETGTATILQNGVKPSFPEGTGKESSGKAIQKPVSTGRQSKDVRRAALISSGAQAHVQRGRSPSAPLIPTADIPGMAPPFPVPTRSSSRQVPLNSSDGTGSPTPHTVSFFAAGQTREKQPRPPIKKPQLRKIRSATNNAYNVQARNHSPPPSSPSNFTEISQSSHPPLPQDDITSPFRQTFRRGSQQKSSAASAANESVTSEQNISAADAIAQVMIGEWMWKYTRKRSLGWPEKASTEFENNRVSGMNSGGIRYQRWVWVQPFDRTVIWSSKQPQDFKGLLGKGGRKCMSFLCPVSLIAHTKLSAVTIESVLDVRDENPPPKGADPSSCFNRSILILTPQRALKFTATTRARHYVWLAALSFLADPSKTEAELGSFVPRPLHDPILPPPSREEPRQPSFKNELIRRHPIRDSIRLAKGKARPGTGKRSYTSPTNSSIRETQERSERQSSLLQEQSPQGDAAEPPMVPRTTGQTRRRSNTGSRSNPPSSSFRSFTSSAKPSNHSLRSRQGSETSHGWVTDGGANSRYGSLRAGSSMARNNVSSQSIQAQSPNFFEAVGTVRMEAFIQEMPNARNSAQLSSGRPSQLPPTRPAPAPPSGYAGPSSYAGNVGSIGGYQTDGGADAPDVERRERSSYRTRQGRKKDIKKYWAGTDEVPPLATTGG